ncbi:hypothetical protein BT96DRAFT_937009 [Gymnopus androsaceus JB14]|uniref:Serine/threonine-protein phosphatase 2A activator n=1 Tax=Gymnopus androsaceus JB14 TaxID=1447944 RepID=A0A6A4HYE8_9AGAR|nr:hypothetical protein BT96DRAFT_937009 [Gymnopus androsaceus JB14]
MEEWSESDRNQTKKEDRTIVQILQLLEKATIWSNGLAEEAQQEPGWPEGSDSPMLDDISPVKTWDKVKQGMIKMYKAEVMDKLPWLPASIYADFSDVRSGHAHPLSHLPSAGVGGIDGDLDGAGKREVGETVVEFVYLRRLAEQAKVATGPRNLLLSSVRLAGLKYAISDKDGHVNSKKSLKIPKKSPGAPTCVYVHYTALDTSFKVFEDILGRVIRYST